MKVFTGSLVLMDDDRVRMDHGLELGRGRVLQVVRVYARRIQTSLWRLRS